MRLFCFLAFSKTLYKLKFSSFRVFLFLVSINSPATKALAPINTEGKIGKDNAKYGTAKNALPIKAEIVSLCFIKSHP